MPDLTDKYVPQDRMPLENPNLTFLRNEWPNYRIFALQGGTRSAKTTGAVQFIWANLAAFKGVEYSIVRGTLPALKSTVMRDFIHWGREAKRYNQSDHNLTEGYYRHNGNMVDFFSAEDDEKVRGRKRHVLYLNEGPECNWPVVQQLLWRTSAKIIIDYNPSYPESWVYDKILPRADCAMIRTTFKNNPFLSKGQLDELEWMRENDPENYVVYGLGQRGELKGQVYKNWKEIKDMPTEYPPVYIVDFGFTNDPACIAEFRMHNRSIYGREHVYSTGLDNVDLAIHLHFKGATQNSVIIADSAEPKSVQELRGGWELDPAYLRNKAAQLGYHPNDSELAMLKAAIGVGYPVLLARKGPDSVDNGIQKLKQFEVFVTGDSINAWREYRKYRWAEDKKTGNLLNVPIDESNHFMDCARYFALSIGHYF